MWLVNKILIFFKNKNTLSEKDIILIERIKYQKEVETFKIKEAIKKGKGAIISLNNKKTIYFCHERGSLILIETFISRVIEEEAKRYISGIVNVSSSRDTIKIITIEEADILIKKYKNELKDINKKNNKKNNKNKNTTINFVEKKRVKKWLKIN